jgi:hypothetical protein
LAVFLNLSIACAFAFAGEGVIEKVVSFSNTTKTSVAIFYSGSEPLRYFVVDSGDNLLTLDLPGVISKFDFSTLEVSQADQIAQQPLDPDITKGISLRFTLKWGVTYDIFDNGSGEMTLLFQSPPSPVAAPPVASTATVEDEPAPTEEASTVAEDGAVTVEPESTPIASTEEPISTGDAPDEENTTTFTPLFREISGQAGKNRISALQLHAEYDHGRILLHVDDLTDYKTFFLEAPKRFVLDLQQTILSLDRNGLSLDLPLIKQIRIRQFRSLPVPVTRLVLDLGMDALVKVLPTETGLLLAFGMDPTSLDHALEGYVAPQPSASAHREPADEATAENGSVSGTELDEITSEPIAEQGERLIPPDLPEEDFSLQQTFDSTQPVQQVSASARAETESSR